MNPAKPSPVKRLSDRGNSGMEYMLVVAVLVLGFTAAFYLPSKGGENFSHRFIRWYHQMTARLAVP